jgi:hypothetical protein
MKTGIIVITSLIAGIFIGIFISNNNSTLSFVRKSDESLILQEFANATKNKQADSIPKIADRIRDSVIKAHIIDTTQAKTIINNYEQYDRKWYNSSLRVELPDADGKDHLKSFFISKILIDTIFKYNPHANGIRLYMAKEKADNKKIFTFVIRGTENSSPLYKAGSNNKRISGDDDPIFNYVDTCPNNCN